MSEEIAKTKRKLRSIFEESAELKRNLKFEGPDRIRPDSRHAILEIGEEFVGFRLVGEDQLILPYANIRMLKTTNTMLTVRYG